MNKPIKVLQMISSLYCGGSQMMVMNLYKNIDKSKVQFDFVVDHPEYKELLPIVEEYGGKVYTVPAFNGFNLFEVIKAWNKLFIDHPEYKILHSHTRSYASIYLPIARKHKVKTIIHSHNTSNGKKKNAIFKAILQYPLRFVSDYYMACSVDAGKWLFGDGIVNSNKFNVLYNAIDYKKFEFNKKIRDKYRKDFNIGNKTVYIQVGSFSEQKNHSFTLNLFSEILKKKNDCFLVLVGDGEYRNDIEKQIEQLSLKENVMLLGKRDDVASLLMMADCYLMPSVFEGLSVAAIEAQASGITCLLSDTVSKDVKIADFVEFLPLDINTWLDKCLNKFDRNNIQKNDDYLKYNILNSVKWLEKYYENIIR